MPQTSKDIADSLVGTKHAPPGLAVVEAHAREAHAYFEMKPYPAYGFKKWKVEDRGPHPTCSPTAYRIVRRGARFLFGKGIEIRVAGNQTLEDYLRSAWAGNQMPSRCVAVAEKAALEGGIAFKFSYDPDLTPSLRIDTLSIIDQARFWYHPHDRRRLLMARVQYPFQDPATGKKVWYREEWTDHREIHYKPVPQDDLSGAATPDEYEGWIVESDTENPFGLIPLFHVQNLDVDDVFGAGDLWNLFRQLDDLNLVWYQMKRSNQFDSELNPYYIDAELDDEDVDKPLEPGEPVSIKSDNKSGGEGRKAQIIFPSGGNSLRPAMMEYAREIRKVIESAAGSVNIDQSEFTNKGNLTEAVLEQLYQAQLETNAEKRKSFGQNGIELFLEGAARGLQAHGVKLGVTKDEKSFDVQLDWPAPFELSEDEKVARVGRLKSEIGAGFTTQERAVDSAAQMNGVRDIPKLKKELEAAGPPPDQLAQADEADPASATDATKQQKDR